MSWSKSCLAWKDETSLPVVDGLYYNPLTRTREPRRKPHNKYDRTHVREHIPVKPVRIFHGCCGAHSPWDHPRFSGMSSCNSVGSFSSQISTYELIEGRMYWDSLTSFGGCSYGIFQKTLNFILSELMIIFSLCPPQHILRKTNMRQKGEIFLLLGGHTLLWPELKEWMLDAVSRWSGAESHTPFIKRLNCLDFI